MKKVAIIGTQGVPAHYGGFETLAENLINNADPREVEYTVFCSSRDCGARIPSYKGARLKYVPLHANGIQSIPYDMVSMARTLRGYDVILILGVSGCVFLPLVKLFSKAKVIVNIDGLEHRRAKWQGAARKFLLFSEKIAVRFADSLVVDNKGIADYVDEQYGKPSTLIAYGGDHAPREVTEQRSKEILKKYNLTPRDYFLGICRIEPENNCHMILEAFARSGQKLVFVGNWGRSEYSRGLRRVYSSYPNIHITDPVYNLDDLSVLRSHCAAYIHGHSAGGTNPSLVEAMFFGIPVFAFDVVYNRETTGNKADYFGDQVQLQVLSASDPAALSPIGEAMAEIARRRYTWKEISGQYEELY